MCRRAARAPGARHRRMALQAAPLPAMDAWRRWPAAGATPARDAADAAALAALFNSCWLTALARLVADPARGGFRRFNARVVRGRPVPAAGSAVWAELARRGACCEPADDLVAEVLELDAHDRRALAADSV